MSDADDAFNQALAQALVDNSRLTKERDAAVGMLRRLEWQGSDSYAIPCCPECEGYEAYGHASDCELAKLIGAEGS